MYICISMYRVYILIYISMYRVCISNVYETAIRHAFDMHRDIWIYIHMHKDIWYHPRLVPIDTGVHLYKIYQYTYIIHIYKRSLGNNLKRQRSVLQRFAACCSCSVIQRDAVWCSVVQCNAVWCSVGQCGAVWCSVVQCDAVWCSVISVLQSNAVWCSVVQRGAVLSNVTLQHTATHLSNAATHCNTLQHTAPHCTTLPSKVTYS